MGYGEPGNRQLVVILRPAGLAYDPVPSPLPGILRRFEARMTPLSARTEYAPSGLSRDLGALAKYRAVEADDNVLDKLAYELMKSKAVDGAYVKPAPALPQINTMQPNAPAATGPTPDYRRDQRYLNAATDGIDAAFAWTLPGGKGEGVTIIDIEQGWNFGHENLVHNKLGLVAGKNGYYGDHGTAVVGEMGGDGRGFGVTGICADAMIGAVSWIAPDLRTPWGISVAIEQAADRLSPGDIMLIEIHSPGPQHDAAGSPQNGYIPVEWWPDNFDAILEATERGIIVVEAAGNGACDLDDPIYETPEMVDGRSIFGPDWSNSLNRKNRDSGAILVGAGAPPPLPFGPQHGPDRSRLDFSNWGSSLDAQGWGRQVTTCGYGDLQGGVQDRWYTGQFSGTSSASPIIAGALGCLQGIRRAQGRTPLTSIQARDMLRASGSPQRSAPGAPLTQRIGARPNLRDLINLSNAIA